MTDELAELLDTINGKQDNSRGKITPEAALRVKEEVVSGVRKSSATQ